MNEWTCSIRNTSTHFLLNRKHLETTPSQRPIHNTIKIPTLFFFFLLFNPQTLTYFFQRTQINQTFNFLFKSNLFDLNRFLNICFHPMKCDIFKTRFLILESISFGEKNSPKIVLNLCNFEN